MTHPVGFSANHLQATSHYQSVSELCRLNDPKQLLQALTSGLAHDNQTLELVLKKTYEALQACGSYGPAHASDDAAQNFYDWERVVSCLLERSVVVTDSALSYGHLIGRGLPEKLQKARATPCIIL